MTTTGNSDAKDPASRSAASRRARRASRSGLRMWLRPTRLGSLWGPTSLWRGYLWLKRAPRVGSWIVEQNIRGYPSRERASLLSLGLSTSCEAKWLALLIKICCCSDDMQQPVMKEHSHDRRITKQRRRRRGIP